MLTLDGICVPPTVNYLQYLATGSTFTAIVRIRAFAVAGPIFWNSLLDFMWDPTISADCFRRLLLICLLNTSAFRALEVLDNKCTINLFSYLLLPGLTKG